MKFYYLPFFTFYFLLFTLKVFGQTNKPCNSFDCVYKKAESFLNSGQYQQAFENLDSAEGYLTDTNIREKDQIKQLRRRLFIAIEKEKEDAKKARDEARRQTEIAQKALVQVEIEKKAAIEEKNKAQKKSRTANNISKYFEHSKTDPTLAMRIAEYNLSCYPEDPNSYLNFSQCVSDTNNLFYRKKFLNGMRNALKDITVSPNSKYLLGINGKTAIIWDLLGDSLFQTFKHSSEVTCAVFSPNNNMVLTGIPGDTVILWDIKSSTVVKTFSYSEETVYTKHGGEALFSPDGKFIILEASDLGAILFDITSGKEIRRFLEKGVLRNGLPDYVVSMAFSPNSRHVLTGQCNGDIIIWDVFDGKIIHKFTEHKGYISSLAFSQNGNKILSTSADKTIRVWDMKSKECICVINYEGKAIFSSDDNLILTIGGFDEVLKLWDSSNGKLINNYHLKYKLNDITYAHNGKDFFVLGGDFSLGGNFSLGFELPTTGKFLKKFLGHNSFISSIIFSLDGQKILTSSFDKTAIIWDLESAQQIKTFLHSSTLHSAIFSPDEKTILTCSDSVAIIWDISSERILREFKHLGDVEYATFSKEGKFILTLCEDTVCLWRTSNGELLQAFFEENYSIDEIAYSSNGLYILTKGFVEDSARLWDINSGKFVKKTIEKVERLYSYDLFTKNWWLSDGEIRLQDSNREGVYNLMQKVNLNNEYVALMALSPDGRKFITGGQNGSLNLCETYDVILNKYVYPYSISELRAVGLELEPDDLITLWNQGEKLSNEELKLINKTENKF